MVKNNPHRFAYIGCLYNSLDKASDEISYALYDDSVCEILTENEIKTLDRANQDIINVLKKLDSRIAEFGIHAEVRVNIALKELGSGYNDE